MGQGRKLESPRIPPLADHHVVRLAVTLGHVGQRKVGQPQEDGVYPFLQLADLLLQLADALPHPAHLFDHRWRGLLTGGPHLAQATADLVPLRPQLITLAVQLPPLDV